MSRLLSDSECYLTQMAYAQSRGQQIRTQKFVDALQKLTRRKENLSSSQVASLLGLMTEEGDGRREDGRREERKKERRRAETGGEVGRFVQRASRCKH